MNEMVMFGRTMVQHRLSFSRTPIPVIVFRSTLFNFPSEMRYMRHPSTMGSGVSDFNTLTEKMLERKEEAFTLSLYKAIQSDLCTKEDTFFVLQREGIDSESLLIEVIKSSINEHFKEVDYIDCEETDASALLVGIC